MTKQFSDIASFFPTFSKKSGMARLQYYTKAKWLPRLLFFFFHMELISSHSKKAARREWKIFVQRSTMERRFLRGLTIQPMLELPAVFTNTPANNPKNGVFRKNSSLLVIFDDLTIETPARNHDVGVPGLNQKF